MFLEKEFYGLNVFTVEGVFYYEIYPDTYNNEGYNNDFIILPKYFSTSIRLSDFKRKKGRLKHSYKNEVITIRYSSLDEEKDKDLIDLFLKYSPKKEDLEKILSETRINKTKQTFVIKK